MIFARIFFSFCNYPVHCLGRLKKIVFPVEIALVEKNEWRACGFSGKAKAHARTAGPPPIHLKINK